MKRLIAFSMVLTACSASDGRDDVDETGNVSVGLTLADPSHDVAAIRFDVHPAGATCADVPLESATYPLEGEGLPTSLLPAGAGEDHPFADGLFTLEPGAYLVCATPLTASGAPSAECAPASGDVQVIAGTTTEVVLVSQCEGVEAGLADIVATLNSPPQLLGLVIRPSKFILTCEEAILLADVQDPDGDEVELAWAVTDRPVGSNPTIVVAATEVSFTTDMPGDYEVTLTATDPFGASTSVSFPIHVSPSDDPNCGPGQTEPVDLRPIPAFDFPDPLAFCDLSVLGLNVTIENLGPGAAPASTTRVRFSTTSGPVVVDLPTPPIGPGAQTGLPPIPIPPGCYTPDCGFVIEADVLSQTPDIDPSNNVEAGYCLG